MCEAAHSRKGRLPQRERERGRGEDEEEEEVVEGETVNGERLFWEDKKLKPCATPLRTLAL